MEKERYTWAKLKEFCLTLTDNQLKQAVKVIREDDIIKILDASELEEDKYLFDNDDEYSVGKSDFDPEYHLDGKYKTFEEAIASEPHSITPKTNIYLFEDFCFEVPKNVQYQTGQSVYCHLIKTKGIVTLKENNDYYVELEDGHGAWFTCNEIESA